MTEKDLQIQNLKVDNEKLKEELEQLKQPKAAADTDMDKLTTEMMEHICDNLCKHPIRAGQTQDELEDICAECKMGKFVCDILNTYNHRMKQLTELKESSLDPIEMCKVKIALDKLKEYQRLEEQGLLLKLPCKVGTTVYSVARDCGGDTLDCRCMDCEDCRYLYTYVEENAFDTWMCDEIGKSIFLTEQEALEKMKGE